MSGPKCDTFVLSAEELRRQREEQERLRQEELKRIQEEKRRREISGQADVLLERFLAMARTQEDRSISDETLKHRFEDIYDEYRAAANLAEAEADTFEFSERNAEVIIAKMQEKIEQWNALALSRRCTLRVNEIIDETIEEMGYELIGERQSEDWKHPSAKLYQYDKDTAISVISANGQFTLEVVTQDTADRPATEEEAAMLEEHMEVFCADYDKLKERLASKNLLETKSIFHLPPNKAYARVVNTSAYRKTKRTRKVGSDYTEEANQKVAYGKKRI